ncbi:hypothetical protein Indivirus_1_211 [Indivirus ILV1]|uniref:Uncharacterized protein n=1 Tax=Indivirus ILV1 TaxID=1977633 RepID=A0A1V0SD53_9VIRU|nr:hypothetical protein Indivirus_1_211 [Indivirus ILV1]
MSSEVYQETGNKIPVTEDELLKVMNKKYNEYYYDNTLSNPDKTEVIYTTSDGKLIKIPDEVKMKAKTIWLKSLMEQKSEEIKKEKENTSNIGNITGLVFIVIIALYLLYVFSQNKY